MNDLINNFQEMDEGNVIEILRVASLVEKSPYIN